MDLSISQKLQEMYDDVNLIKKDIENDNLQKIFIGHIRNIIEYTVARNDRMFAQQIFEFIVDMFMIIGELDYDSVEPVLDALTTSRIIIKNVINQ